LIRCSFLVTRTASIKPSTHPVKSWLQLLRAPNLLTVPGDPLAGFLLAYGSTHGGSAFLDEKAAVAALASLLFYSAGLVMNDIVDLAEDRRDRPSRPLASGAVSVRAAWIATVLFAGVGLVAMTAVADRAGLFASSVLLGVIGLYNGVTKRFPIIGALNMGACRGLSLFLGAVAATGTLEQPPFVILCAAIVTAYIAAVTNLARHETREQVPTLAKALPAVIMLGAFLLFSAGHGPMIQRHATTLLAVALIFAAAEVGQLFRKNPPPLPPVIGALIRVLLPIQAAFCLVFPTSYAAWITAGALLALIPASRWLGRWFYAS
jgi:4-hydroxybenzoate polyprenyltransferase